MKINSSKPSSARVRVEIPETPVTFGIGQSGDDPKHVSFGSHVQNAERHYSGQFTMDEAKEILRQIICLEPLWIKEVADAIEPHNNSAFENVFKPASEIQPPNANGPVA